MTKDTEKRFMVIEKIMKQHDPKERKNIMDSIRNMKRMEPQDELEIENRFAELCKNNDYDPTYFTTAKSVETI